MADPDRWVSKILALPIFDGEFRDAVRSSPFAGVAFISAMDLESGAQFAGKVMSVASSLEAKAANAFQGREGMLEQFWSLVVSIEKTFFESTAVQLGFGLCERSLPPTPVDAAARLRKQAAITGLLRQQAPQPKRAKVDPSSSSSKTPLLDKEKSEKWRWAARLEAIAQRAGQFSRLFKEDEHSAEPSPGERLQLKQLVLIAGAHRTMAAHIPTFERFEKWSGVNSFEIYPMSIEKILKYALFLNERECGPSVLPSLRASVKWVCSRLAIDGPDFDDHRFQALVQQVVNERAKTLKEAIPLPIGVVGALETTVMCETDQVPLRIFVWWLLCMSFASLRFDDAVHVKPHELEMRDEGLFGVAWQTKVERKRVGTRFVVPKVGFRQSAWLETGWALFKDFQSFDRDYWVPELNARDEFKNEPPSYPRSLQWLKYLSRRAIDGADWLRQEEQVSCARVINNLTIHSCRVTLLDAAVHAGRSTEEIGLQANWKDPGPMVLKYTRNRSAVPAVMVRQLVHDLVQSAHPVQEDAETLLLDGRDVELNDIEFFVKTASSATYYEYKFHCSARSNDSLTACSKFALSECSSVGSTLPDISVFCKACAKARPEVEASYARGSASSD